MTHKELADILFPSIHESMEDIERKYSKRSINKKSEVTRFGASPTGYINIGGLYTAFISWKIAKQTNGLFILRIEDNNQRDIVSGGIESFVNALLKYDISFDEGYFSKEVELGEYGPYTQTSRKGIYQVFVKSLVERGIAYPCFCSIEQLNDMRKQQLLDKKKTGYYGKYAKCRYLTLEEAADLAKKGSPFVIRIRSEYLREYKNDYYDDGIKGRVRLSSTDLDLVILKESGIPDYNFAHVIDDHLMGTTVITRCEDWLPSLYTHLALFNIMGWKPPRYAHIGAISIKLDRSIVKVSKKLGYRVTVEYYLKKGYITEAVHKYFLMTACADYEQFWLENREDEYIFSLKKMNAHGALLDENKLDFVSRREIDKLSVDTIYTKYVQWLKEYHPDVCGMVLDDSEFVKKLICIIKGVEKPRFAVCYFEQLMDEMFPFFNAPYTEQMTKRDKECLEIFALNIVNQRWDDLKMLNTDILNFCEEKSISVKELCMALRKMIVGKTKSPSVYEMLMILGKERIYNWLYVICNK